MQDDFYDGYFIPKGSLVFANIWAMLRDPDVFPEPDRFNPERYLEKVDEETARRRDPRVFVFGFGRRRCPGAHLVESSVWLMLATMLAMLNIEKPRDKNDKEIEPDVKFENSVFRSVFFSRKMKTFFDHRHAGRPLVLASSCAHGLTWFSSLSKKRLECTQTSPGEFFFLSFGSIVTSLSHDASPRKCRIDMVKNMRLS